MATGSVLTAGRIPVYRSWIDRLLQELDKGTV